ncbi:hypothetical protein ES705_37234 [subsurface metagenome]
MKKAVNPSRRNVLKKSLTGVAGAAAANLALPRRAKAAIEKDGRPVILAFMGQHCHNPIFMELNLRATLAKMNWRVFFTQYGEFVTPENIAKADVLITLAANNTYKGWSVGYTPEGLVEERPTTKPYMTAEQEDAIIDGIKNRGMGFMCLHNSLYKPTPKLQALLAHEFGFHPPVQPVLYKDLNQEHPITRGLDYWVEDDEQFFARLGNPDHTVLFKSEGARDHRETIAGWCFEHGKGRVVAMIPGHTEFVWQHPTWQQLVLRSCLWQMRMPIPDDTLSLVARQKVAVRHPGGFNS